jgi:hypothetical protein
MFNVNLTGKKKKKKEKTHHNKRAGSVVQGVDLEFKPQYHKKKKKVKRKKPVKCAYITFYLYNDENLIVSNSLAMTNFLVIKYSFTSPLMDLCENFS